MKNVIPVKTGIRCALTAICFIVLSAHGALAHEKHSHGAPATPAPPPDNPQKAALVAIGARYAAEIEPVFKRVCFDCHSSKNRYPWYYAIPGAKQLIDYDIRESREHLDMDKGYPFKSHATMREDLEEIAKTVRKNKMPPWRYRIFHREEALTEAERDKIVTWAEESLKQLVNAGK
ncbi:MAG: heme-binding domain-containing protein [Nitrospinae bacterium]|nr:heme-binding domain-containing protein [Nitrospinota bacterium]